MNLLKKEWISLYKFLDGLQPNEVGDRAANANLDNALVKIHAAVEAELIELARLQLEFDKTTIKHKQALIEAQMGLKSSPKDENLLAAQQSAIDFLDYLQSMHILAADDIFFKDSMMEEAEVKFSKPEQLEVKQQFDKHGLKLLSRQLYAVFAGKFV